jgi:hypothetical protein
MKNLVFVLILFITSLSLGQEEIKIPELDIGNEVYTLEFNPDPQNEEVISAYMQGTTEKDSLRFWAEGTTLLQKVMVTVITDNTSEINVDIVKANWKDSKINGHTKNGLFQESFETAGTFGIVINSTKPNISFQLAVWTTGENIPFMGNLYYSASDEATSRGGQMVANVISEQQDVTIFNDSNTLMYITMGFFCIITLLLVLLLIKKRATKTLMIFFCFILSQETSIAQARPSLSEVFTGALSFVIENHDGIQDFFEGANNVANEIRRRLGPDDDDAQAQVDANGGPRLPSSCIPPQFGTSRNSNANSTSQGSGNSSSTNTTFEPISTSTSNSDANNNTENENYEELDSSGRPIYDRNNHRVDYPVFGDDERPEYDINGEPIEYGEQSHNDALDSFERPVYDRDNRPIDYPVFGDDKRPKYDINGQAIKYAEGDTEPRPRLDTNKKPIEYDNTNRPKYDNKGNPINYHKDDFKNPAKRNKENGFPVEEKQSLEKIKNNDNSPNGTLMAVLKITKHINSIDVNINTKEFKNKDFKVKYAEANLFGTISSLITYENDNEAGCACLEKEYDNLNNRRLNLERLRVIFAHAMKKINAGMAFGDNVSGVHGVSGLVWQSQKMIILTKSIPTLNKAYDDKYAEMIHALEENLRAIENCEAMLGYDNWYNHAGFIYYQFMADKYKRN